MDKDTISVVNLTKTYGERTVLGPISFTIRKGQVVSLIGTNGAGKTTLLEILGGERLPTSGEVSVFGQLPGSEGCVLLPQTLELFGNLTVRENIRHFAILSGGGNVDQLMEMFSLSDRADERYGALSGGLKQRVNVACIMCGNPELILMDEPNTGMDPQVRADVWDIIHKLRKHGVTVILSTHFLGEARRNSERIIVMNRGSIVYDGDPFGFNSTRISVTVKGNNSVHGLEAYSPKVCGDRVTFIANSPFQLGSLMNELVSNGVDLKELVIITEDSLGGLE